MSLLKNYKHQGPIGAGYFCTVARYLPLSGNSAIAVKTLKLEHRNNKEYRDRFLREISLLRDLKGHPHIVELLGHEEDSEAATLWYAMPLAKENLFNLIKRENSKIQLRYRISLFEGILSAIKHAHGKSILHRDISPNNVLVFEHKDEIWCELSDFGLGKDSDAINFTRTSINGFGQVLYVSPEQKDHLKKADERSDIYSLGKLLYFIMNGKDPTDIRGGDFYPLIRKSIEENPKDRFQNLEEFEEEFNNLKEFLTAPGLPPAQQTIREYLVDKKRITDWKEFHNVAVTGNFHNDFFMDYVGTLTFFLIKDGNLEAYHKAMRREFVHFVETYNNAVTELPRNQNGFWPFKALDDFALLNDKVFRMSDDNDIKLRCLTQIWDIAWESDQFSAQKQFRDLQSENLIPEAIVSVFAQHMVSNSRRRKANINPFMGRTTPTLIKRALLSLTDNK